jgi:plastocyanin
MAFGGAARPSAIMVPRRADVVGETSMRKGIWSVAAAVVLLSGSGVLWGVPRALAADARVAMGSDSAPFKFIEADITVPVGGTVEWHNDTSLEHDVKAEDGSFGSDGLLGKNGKFEFKFTKPGSFKYFCTPHKDAGMAGTVTVTGGSTATTAATTTTTTAPAPGATTTTTAKAADGSATTTTAAAGATTTTTAAAGGATTTTLAPATTPSSAPDTAGTTPTTAKADDHGEEAAGGEHSGGSGGEDTNALGVAFAGVLTLILGGISVKMLVAKV